MLNVNRERNGDGSSQNYENVENVSLNGNPIDISIGIRKKNLNGNHGAKNVNKKEETYKSKLYVV